jgi:hypothetical protein
MRILRAVGLGIVIILLQFLVPRLFSSFENAAISFFELFETTMEVSQTAVAENGFSIPQFSR